jgi:serine/threonine-protein kinase
VSLDRFVALKLFSENVQRVMAASKAVAQLKHPNVVPVYDCGEREGLLYVAEELIEGGHLGQRLAAGPLPPAEAAGMAEVLARALHHVHQRGIVHRNLKPRVVLLTEDGTPKVSSFDLARLLHAPQAEPEGTIVGTLTYMAPEQAAGQPVGPAADVYALGAILYEMLTGRPPFVPASDDPGKLLSQVLHAAPPPPRQLRPTVPPALEAVCLRCLAKEPARRYASAADLAGELRVFLSGPRARTGAPVAGFWRRLLGWLRGSTARS